jgi:hypothetical protein
MPSSHDLHITRQIAPTVFSVDGGFLVCRGLREVKPRRFHAAKTAATLIRQVASPLNEEISSKTATRLPVQEAVLMANIADGGDSELEPLFGYLPDFPSITISVNMLPVLLTSIRNLDRPTVVAAFGDSTAPVNEAHADFAKSLNNYNRSAEEEIVQRLMAQAKAVADLRQDSIGSRHDVMTLQEKPGKAFTLNLWEPTLKIALKRWQVAASRMHTQGGSDLQKNSAAKKLPPLVCADGWGLGALTLRRDGSPEQRRFSLASIELRLPSPRFDLNTVSLLAQAADSWLLELKAPSLAGLERVTLSIPSPIITAHVKQGLCDFTNGKLSDQNFAFPDLLWGWQPVLTFIEFLTRSELPSLFINTGRFPLINLVALWPA